MDDALAVTWIVGAGSGVGRASATALAATGRRLVLSGRRHERLEETCRGVRDAGGSAAAHVLDATDDDAVRAAATRIADEFGPIAEVIFCAGRNVPERSWAELDPAGFRDVVEADLIAVATTISAVLPGMRERGYGRVVVLSSWAGWTLGRGAGVAYSASKTALASLTEQLNDQESAHGVSACVVCPGDIDTAFVDQRPSVPDAAARARMLRPEDVARAVAFVVTSPREVCVNELVITPVRSHSYGR
ncbi:SDR family oxidoreductase [Pseudactinotalea sp. HY158]|uniref:SDR family oxidoreductase n=1 Tax=Pseudactinotalea sp. HY158 TaxID=2654547 RepID=UPI00129CF8BA|nr:SDR family NAD(P)-dependent oxidoreductase [Pseudactinotalea sp. HY158]QGH68755.1 SDR family NAD(P)-dependent oxidoreductase [Pseudactinotalea sp. HY158]